MDENETAIGQRVAHLRSERGLRQEDFLPLLEARGVKWTQTVLSRVEGGKRSLKATEAFAVADALGVSADLLNPVAGSLGYSVESYRLKYREAKGAAERAAGIAEQIKNQLVALWLANELSQGRADFTVYGTPGDFIALLAEALSPVVGMWRDDDAYRALGLNPDAVEEEFQARAKDRFGDEERLADDEYFQLRDEAEGVVLARKFPALKFVGMGSGFAIEGIMAEFEPPRKQFGRADGG